MGDGVPRMRPQISAAGSPMRGVRLEVGPETQTMRFLNDALIYRRKVKV